MTRVVLIVQGVVVVGDLPEGMTAQAALTSDDTLELFKVSIADRQEITSLSVKTAMVSAIGVSPRPTASQAMAAVQAGMKSGRNRSREP